MKIDLICLFKCNFVKVKVDFAFSCSYFFNITINQPDVEFEIESFWNENLSKQARKARRCDSYLQIWNNQSLTHSLTDWLTGVGARRCYRCQVSWRIWLGSTLQVLDLLSHLKGVCCNHDVEICCVSLFPRWILL